jgi:chromosome segregation ATPase
MLWSQQLELFLGVYESKLRFFTPELQLVHSPEERVEAAQRQVEAERQQREAAQKEVEAERQQREVAQREADAAQQQREAAQRKVEELLARLKQLGVKQN